MLIFFNKSGQLGNRLFAFAHLIAVARKHNLKVVNLSFGEYSKYFTQTAKDIWCRYPPQQSLLRSDKLRSMLFILNGIIVKFLRAIKVKESRLHVILTADLPDYDFNDVRFFDLNSDAFLNLARKKPVFMYGRFFRDYDGMDKFQNDIRAYFIPIPSLRNEIDKFVSKVKHGCDIVVGVHIRRGDYEFFVNGKYFYTQLAYMGLMVQLSIVTKKKIRFLVSSNEEIDCSVFHGLDVVIAPGHLVKDLYCLSKCDYIMGAPSTYTKWAAFYGSKPLYHIKSIENTINLEKFTLLPPENLFNFSFN